MTDIKKKKISSNNEKGHSKTEKTDHYYIRDCQRSESTQGQGSSTLINRAIYQRQLKSKFRECLESLSPQILKCFRTAK